MTRYCFPSLIVAALLLCQVAGYSADKSAKIKIACVGDSITAANRPRNSKHRDKNSYPAQLNKMLGEKYLVKNFGHSGATLLKNGDKPYWKQGDYKNALAFEPNIVVIKLGTNDSKPQNWSKKAEFMPDYIAMIESFQKLPSKPMVWICKPVPAFPGRWAITDKVIREEVGPEVAKVGKKASVKVIDLYTALSGKKELFPDTVHPNVEGSKLIAKGVYKALTAEKGKKNVAAK